MGLPTASSIATSRVNHIKNNERPDLFCDECTAYIGAALARRELHAEECTGDPVQHVRDIHPANVLEH